MENGKAEWEITNPNSQGNVINKWKIVFTKTSDSSKREKRVFFFFMLIEY